MGMLWRTAHVSVCITSQLGTQ